MSDIPLTAEPGETRRSQPRPPGWQGRPDCGPRGGCRGRPARAAGSRSRWASTLRVWWLRVRSGDSGVLPVVLGDRGSRCRLPDRGLQVPVGAESGQSLRAEHHLQMCCWRSGRDLRPAPRGDRLVRRPGHGAEQRRGCRACAAWASCAAFPWWAAIIVALLICSAVGAFQGWLVARLRMPSFIVTLGGLLILEGIAIVIVLGKNGSYVASARQPGAQRAPSSTTFSTGTSARWSAGFCWQRCSEPLPQGSCCATSWASASSRQFGDTCPRSLAVMKMVLVAAARNRGSSAICNVNRAHFGIDRGGFPTSSFRSSLSCFRRVDGPAPANPLRPLRGTPPVATPRQRGELAVRVPVIRIRAFVLAAPDLRRRRHGAIRLVAGLADLQHHQVRQQLRACWRSLPQSSAAPACSVAAGRPSTACWAASSSVASTTA